VVSWFQTVLSNGSACAATAWRASGGAHLASGGGVVVDLGEFFFEVRAVYKLKAVVDP
jgi:hypothetical protein